MELGWISKRHIVRFVRILSVKIFVSVTYLTALTGVQLSKETVLLFGIWSFEHIYLFMRRLALDHSLLYVMQRCGLRYNALPKYHYTRD